MVANTIVVMDEKGGAAKTTLSLLLAQALGNAGYKTCAGDLESNYGSRSERRRTRRDLFCTKKRNRSS